MKHTIYFPLYNIHSDLVKTAIGLKDNRSVEQFFKEAGIEILDIGKKRCVKCEDILNVARGRISYMKYEAQSELSKQIDNLE